MSRRHNTQPRRQRSSTGDPPFYQQDESERDRRRAGNRTVMGIIRKKLTRERTVSEEENRFHHPPLTKAYTLPARVNNEPSNDPVLWGLEETQGDSDESLDSGGGGTEGSGNTSDSSPLNQRYSIYDEVAVQKAFGPAMKDVGRWFVQQQRRQYMSIEQLEQERLGSRPPLPLPSDRVDGRDYQGGDPEVSYYGEVSVYEHVHRQPRLLGTNGLQLGLRDLARYGWYWGPLTRLEAEEKLSGHNDGTFLVRDSSDERYLLSLSFRSQGKSLHTRIEYCNGRFSFYSFPDSENEGYASVAELIEKSMQYSSVGVFCFSRARAVGSPAVPVRLLKPLSRLTKVRSLQHYCRFVIRQSIRFDSIRQLPLPRHVHSYLEGSQF